MSETNKRGLPRRHAPPTRGRRPREEVRVLWGISLLEILVVIAVFAILAVLASSAILLTLRGARKSESLLGVRENIDFSIAVIERNLRNANRISPCPNPITTVIDYQDELGESAAFSCDLSASPGFIASVSARLTSDSVDVTACSFICVAGTGGTPDSVDISITATDASSTGAESAVVTSNTKVFLRNY